MNTNARAMTWELLARNPWSLAGNAALSFGTLALMFGFLAAKGALLSDEESMAKFHMLAVMMNATMFGSTVVAAQWPMQHLRAAPATTRTLVAWRMLPAMVLMFIETIAFLLLIDNLWLQFNGPLFGPASASAAAIGLVLAAVWFALGSVWMVPAMVVLFAPLGVWFSTRYHPWFSDDARMWSGATPADGLFLVTMAAVAYAVAVAGVNRNRRGEPPLSIGFVAWAASLLKPPAAPRPFARALDAQLWAEWRRKGWFMPAGGTIMLMIGLVAWTFAGFPPDELVEGLYNGPFMIGIIACVGGMWINVMPTRTAGVMGSFLATRPLSSRAIAGSLLRVAAKSLVITWLLWATAFAIAAAGLHLALGEIPGLDRKPALQQGNADLYIAASLLIPWAILGSITAGTATGRPELFGRIVAGAVFTYIAADVTARIAGPPELLDLVPQAFFWIACVTALGGSLFLFIRAIRRGLVKRHTARWIGAIWLAASVAVVGRQFTMPQEPLGVAAELAIIALAALPFAAMPLAVAWNRVR